MKKHLFLIVVSFFTLASCTPHDDIFEEYRPSFVESYLYPLSLRARAVDTGIFIELTINSGEKFDSLCVANGDFSYGGKKTPLPTSPVLGEQLLSLTVSLDYGVDSALVTDITHLARCFYKSYDLFINNGYVWVPK